MDCKQFIREQIAEIKKTVGNESAINALSGGVDSSTVTVLGHRALVLRPQEDPPPRQLLDHLRPALGLERRVPRHLPPRAVAG